MLPETVFAPIWSGVPMMSRKMSPETVSAVKPMMVPWAVMSPLMLWPLILP